MSAFIRLRLHILALLALAAVIAGQFGSLFWPAELFSHFLPHYAAIFILAAIWPRPKWRTLWLVCAAASLLWLAQPFTLPDAPSGGTRLVWYNVHLDNPGWQSLRQAYPHGCQHREHSPFALALWSKQPLAACEVHMIGDYPYIRAQTADGTALYALHPPPPISSELAGARQHYLAETARAPATRYFTPTWKPFFLNIDHALAKGLNVSARTLPWQHSDHRPLLVEYTGQ